MKVFIVGSGEVHSCVEADIVKVCHPKQGSAIPFLILNKRLFEIQRLRQSPSSWIFGTTIVQDGSIYLASKFDTTYLAIAALSSFKAEKPDVARRFCAPSEVLSALPLHIRRLVETTAQLDKICDTQDVMGTMYIRWSDDKLNAFLRKKVERIEAHLEEQSKSIFENVENTPSSSEGISSSPSAPASSSSSSIDAPETSQSSSTTNSSSSPPASSTDPSKKSNSEGDASESDKTSSSEEKAEKPAVPAAVSDSSRSRTKALQIIGEYMPCDLFDVFVKKEFGISSSTVFGIKKRGRRSTENIDPDVMPVGTRDMFDDDEGPKKKESTKKKPKISRSQSQLSKVNTKGMKSLSSYFGKPKKKKKASK